MIKLQDFTNWQKNEVTIEIFKQLEYLKQIYLEQILAGSVNTNKSEKAIYEFIGRVNAYDDLLNINYNNLGNNLTDLENS